MKRLDIIELGGRGGVYQHAVAAAQDLQPTVRVRILSAADAEPLQAGITHKSIFSWHRTAKSFRAIRIVVSFFARALPSALLFGSRTVWVQGTFKPLLTSILILLLRMTGRRVLFSPHNLFSRSGSRRERALIWLCVTMSSHCFLYNQADLSTVRRSKSASSELPLRQFVPRPDPAIEAKWRARTVGGRPIAIFAGQLRRDKNLELALAGCAQADWVLLIVGPDTDQLAEHYRNNAPAGLRAHWEIGYVPLNELCAAIRVADVVLCPYSTVSQSGVASLARSIGTPIAGPALGGLAQQVDYVLPALNADAISETLQTLNTRESRQDSVIRPTDYEQLVSLL